MRIILAPDSFKGSLSALEVCQAMEAGIRRVLSNADILLVPMADGGEGTVRSLVDATGGEIITTIVTGPLGEKVEAFFGITGDGETAVIEMAAASGLPLVPEKKKNPRITTTYGTGELILAALDKRCKKIIIGIGGSATNDGGAGMAQALGYRFLDQNGQELPFGGAALKDLVKIDSSNKDPRLSEITVVVACDVTNPLIGPDGASAVYGPQKGATLEMVDELDEALSNYARVVEKEFGLKVADLPGSGAAGGLGAGLVTFVNAQLQPGVKIISDTIDLKSKMQGADLVITGEGRIDGQTIKGKTPIGVASVAKELGIPVLGVAGSIGYQAELVYDHGIDGMIVITDRPMTLEEAIFSAAELVIAATERIFRTFLAGRCNKQI